MSRLEVTVGDGKYTIIMEDNGHLKALRYGKEWRDLVGDGMVLALAQEVQNLRDKYEKKSEPVDPYVEKEFRNRYGDSNET